MRRLVAAVLVGAGVFITFSSNAAELCGPQYYRGGSHARCIAHRGRWARGLEWGQGRWAYGPGYFEARPPCPYGYVWRFRACFPS